MGFPEEIASYKAPADQVAASGADLVVLGSTDVPTVQFLHAGVRAAALHAQDVHRGGIAKRLPLITISDMIGVPEADRERMVAAADLLVTSRTPRRSASARRSKCSARRSGR